MEINKSKVELRPMKESDLELVMAWRSHPDAYIYFREQKGPLAWTEHWNFWSNRKHREDYIIHVCENNRWRKVGNLNLSKLDSDSPAIGIIIGERTLHHQGVGTKAVQQALKLVREKGFSQIFVEIHKLNLASQKLFLKFGFKKNTEQNDSDWETYILERF